ncbi:MAG TPA: GNAT family N-acetyltransferase [Gemmatimonadaceae bacterium]
MNERELMRLHVETLFTHDERGRLLRVNEPSGGVAPRLFIGRTKTGNEWRVRHDIEEELVHELGALWVSARMEDERSTDAYVELLGRFARVQRIWTGPAYRFPDGGLSSSGAIRVTPDNIDVIRPLFSDWIDHVKSGQLCVAVVRGGNAVSVCGSARVTSAAHEAGVETHSDHRGHGYAALAVSAWAAAVRELGCIPLYSTSWTNGASQSVASKLELVRFGADLHIT